ncbi:MAG: ribosome-associated translation inhibitor RaiA [Deltaproteobacteria bacterium]
MKVTVTTRHIGNNQDPEKLKDYAIKKSKRIERYLKSDKNSCEVKFVLWSEKFRDTAEISINSKSLKTTSSFETTEMYTAIDSAIDIIIKQLKKETDKKITSKRRTGAKTKEEATQAKIELDPGTGSLTNIRIQKLPKKPMAVEEASLQLKVSDANFVAFRNSANDTMNIVYIDRRGQITLIEP